MWMLGHENIHEYVLGTADAAAAGRVEERRGSDSSGGAASAEWEKVLGASAVERDDVTNEDDVNNPGTVREGLQFYDDMNGDGRET